MVLLRNNAQSACIVLYYIGSAMGNVHKGCGNVPQTVVRIACGAALSFAVLWVPQGEQTTCPSGLMQQ